MLDKEVLIPVFIMPKIRNPAKKQRFCPFMKGYQQQHSITKDASCQTEHIVGSYHRRRTSDEEESFLTYEQLRTNVLSDYGTLLEWCKDNNLIARRRSCPDCGRDMKWKKSTDGRSDKYVWRCRQRIGGGKEVLKEVSIREGSVFADSNLTIAEIIQFMYWWSCGLTQTQIRQQMDLSRNTGCSWHSKCRDICDFVIMKTPHKIGGKWTLHLN